LVFCRKYNFYVKCTGGEWASGWGIPFRVGNGIGRPVVGSVPDKAEAGGEKGRRRASWGRILGYTGLRKGVPMDPAIRSSVSYRLTLPPARHDPGSFPATRSPHGSRFVARAQSHENRRVLDSPGSNPRAREAHELADETGPTTPRVALVRGKCDIVRSPILHGRRIDAGSTRGAGPLRDRSGPIRGTNRHPT